MSKVVYITNASVDGYIEDETGAFDWVNPDQIHAFITDLVRPMGTYLTLSLAPRLNRSGRSGWYCPKPRAVCPHRTFRSGPREARSPCTGEDSVSVAKAEFHGMRSGQNELGPP